MPVDFAEIETGFARDVLQSGTAREQVGDLLAQGFDPAARAVERDGVAQLRSGLLEGGDLRAEHRVDAKQRRAETRIDRAHNGPGIGVEHGVRGRAEVVCGDVAQIDIGEVQPALSTSVSNEAPSSRRAFAARAAARSE